MQKNKYIDPVFLCVSTRHQIKLIQLYISLFVVRKHRYIQGGHATNKRNTRQVIIIHFRGLNKSNGVQRQQHAELQSDERERRDA